MPANGHKRTVAGLFATALARCGAAEPVVKLQ